MAKAVLTTKGGVTVSLEGSAEEVAVLVERLDGGRSDRAAKHASRSRLQNQGRTTPSGVVGDLIAEGFFARPQDLTAIRAALKDRGHFYPATSLSPVVLRLVRSKQLRRLNEV